MVLCKLCGSATTRLGAKRGLVSGRMFHLHRCRSCDFAFVSDPWTDYRAIYSEAYYRGRGADPYIDYVYEARHPLTTARVYEWRGILANIRALTAIRPDTRWLDFGCGHGGLLDFCRRRHIAAQCIGFEENWAAAEAQESGLAICRRAECLRDAGPFDIVTAIEVFEHLEDPRQTAQLIRSLLKPGGLFYFTTGNPAPHWKRFVRWEYVYPEIHISYYTPETMRRLLAETGFRTEFRGVLPGHRDIIRYKALKRLGCRDRHWSEKMLPWPLISGALDTYLKISDYPIAWRA